MTSMGAPTSAMTLHLSTLKAGRGHDLDLVEAGLVEPVAHVEDSGRRHAGAGEIAELGVAAVAAHRERHVTFEHSIRFGRTQPLDEAPAVGVDAQTQPSVGRHLGKPPADVERVGHLAAEIVHQHDQVLAGEGLGVHLGGADGRTGVANQRVRHGAEAGVVAEVMRGRVVGVAHKALGAGLRLGGMRADGGRIGHELLHLGAGAVPRVHGEERDSGQIDAHGERVVGGHARGAEFLEIEGLEIDQVIERACDVNQRFAGADPIALGEVLLDFERGLARPGHGLQPFDHQARREDDGAAHEDRVGDAPVAEAPHRLLRLDEIAVGPTLDRVGVRPARAGGLLVVHGLGAPALRTPRS